jgi:hypothetical protein
MNSTRSSQTSRGRTGERAEKPGVPPKVRTEPASAQHKPPASVTLNLPLVSMQVRAPRLHVPQVRLDEAAHVVDTAHSLLPPPERVIYYGGLGALVAFGVIEWPVAAAIGAGTVIAQRAARGNRTTPGSGGGKPRAEAA